MTCVQVHSLVLQLIAAAIQEHVNLVRTSLKMYPLLPWERPEEYRYYQQYIPLTFYRAALLCSYAVFEIGE